MNKTVDIFLKSYRNDFWLLQLALATIKKNVGGYNNIILLIPIRDKELFDTRDLPERTLIFYVEDEGTGWLRQQWYKMSAHEYSKADYITFSDSDNFFDHPIDLQDLIKDDRPEILYTNYKQLEDAIIWKYPTELFIGEPVEYEFMRRLPLTYHRDTLIAISRYAPDLENTIMKSHRWSEFNCMGVYAYKFERERYNFVNTDDWTFVPAASTQVWSHASKEKGASETHHLEFIRTLETLLKSFGIITP